MHKTIKTMKQKETRRVWDTVNSLNEELVSISNDIVKVRKLSKQMRLLATELKNPTKEGTFTTCEGSTYLYGDEKCVAIRAIMDQRAITLRRLTDKIRRNYSRLSVPNKYNLNEGDRVRMPLNNHVRELSPETTHRFVRNIIDEVGRNAWLIDKHSPSTAELYRVGGEGAPLKDDIYPTPSVYDPHRRAIVLVLEVINDVAYLRRIGDNELKQICQHERKRAMKRKRPVYEDKTAEEMVTIIERCNVGDTIRLSDIALEVVEDKLNDCEGCPLKEAYGVCKLGSVQQCHLARHEGVAIKLLPVEHWKEEVNEQAEATGEPSEQEDEESPEDLDDLDDLEETPDRSSELKWLQKAEIGDKVKYKGRVCEVTDGIEWVSARCSGEIIVGNIDTKGNGKYLVGDVDTDS